MTLQTLLYGVVTAWVGFWQPTGALGVLESTQPSCGGVLKQGGVVICQGPAAARWQFEDEMRQASLDGSVVFGLARNATSSARISMQSSTSSTGTELLLDIAPRIDPSRVIEGLDCDKVDARTDEQKAHAARSWVTKQDAFKRFHDGPGVSEGFTLPADGRPSSPFGPERKYIGISATTGEPCESFSVHQGYDIAAPVGTEIRAPAGGTVILADPDLYYEGGSVFLDHGNGLTSVFMHMSAVDVAVGETVRQGGRIGAVGNTGRTTGPHLHWAVKWRNPDRESRSGDFYIDPALLLTLSREGVEGDVAADGPNAETR